MPREMVHELGSVLGLNTITLAISFTGIEMILKIILLLVSIIYTITRLMKSKNNK
tara:strand:+ start:92 stop:256 length:165 start_codon:yes stop_codon:yes gene_type:complete